MQAIQALFNLSRQYEEYSTTRRFIDLIIAGIEPGLKLTDQQWRDIEPYIIQATVSIKEDPVRATTDAADFALHIADLAQRNLK